jgi:hypothetical protein
MNGQPLPAPLLATAARLRSLLAAGATPVLVDSPPGAGKTTLVAWAASRRESGARVAVVTCTNNQSAQVALRIAARDPAARVVVYLGADAEPPEALGRSGAPEVVVVRRSADLPAGPCVVVGNLAKWAAHPPAAPGYDLAVFDEAYQMAWHQVWPLSGLAQRHLLVGDPGQIPPFSTVHEQRWLGDPAGPLAPAAAAVAHLFPGTPVLRLPVSLRLPADTAAAIQPALCPGLPFVGQAPRGERRLLLPAAGAAEEAGDLLASSSLTALCVPGAASDLDPGLCAAAATAAAERLLRCGPLIRDQGGCRQLTPERMAIVCARTQQAALVRAALGPLAAGAAVDTANRLQGLEWDVVLAVCPLSGNAALGPFQLEPGRLSVMLTRHRVACLLMTRGCVDDALDAHVPVSERAPGALDPELHGLWAHRAVRAALLPRPGRI